MFFFYWIFIKGDIFFIIFLWKTVFLNKGIDLNTLLTSEKSILAQELTLVHHERQHQDTGQDHRLQHSHIEEFRIDGQVPVTSSKLGAAHAWNEFSHAY